MKKTIGNIYFKLPCLLLAAVFLASAVTCSCAADKATDIDKQIASQEREYKKIQQQISGTKKKISETARKEKNVSRQIEELSQKITLTQQRVNVVNLRVKRLQNNIVRLTGEISDTDTGIQRTQKLLRQRIVSIYKYGGITEFNLLLSSRGAQEAISTSYLLGKIADQDQKLINSLAEQKDRLTNAQRKLMEDQQNYKEQGNVLKVQHKELNAAANERNALLAKVKKDKALYMHEQEELLRASKELQSTVKRLLAQKRALKAKKNPTKKEVVYYKGGRLAWPTQGSISSVFGTRVHPVFKTKINHTGLDISAPKGTPVSAADTGEVLYTGWMRGYGQVIIIDHGGDLTTVYAHLSRIECAEDQKVSRGSVIGRVGSTGVATGNHLHFEVRVNGNAVNPMRYLR